MSGKRPSLFKPVEASAKRGRGAAAPAPKAAPSVAQPVAAAPGRPPSRQGKRVVSVYVEPEALKQLGMMAIREDTSVQALMVEALNDFFAKRGVNRIA